MKVTYENALEAGKAAEHLVCADLIIGGYRAFLSDQGLPYDVVVDFEGHLIRVQVKATHHPKNINSAGRNPRVAYSWNVRRKGKDGYKKLSDSDCDIVALVALDTRAIAYLPIEECGQTVQLRPAGAPALRGSPSAFVGTIEDYPFDSTGTSPVRNGALTHCPSGPEFTAINTRVHPSGSKICKICETRRQQEHRGASRVN